MTDTKRAELEELIDGLRDREAKIKSKTLHANYCEDCDEYVEEPMMVCRYYPGKSPTIKIFPKPVTPLLDAYEELRTQRDELVAALRLSHQCHRNLYLAHWDDMGRTEMDDISYREIDAILKKHGMEGKT